VVQGLEFYPFFYNWENVSQASGPALGMPRRTGAARSVKKKGTGKLRKRGRLDLHFRHSRGVFSIDMAGIYRCISYLREA
jgi:hypothetical protein